MLEKLIPFLIAAALGFAIGLERERRHFKLRSMGVRTFTLLGLLGALAAFLDNTLLAASMALFAGAAIITGYIRTTTILDDDKSHDFGLTTEIAGVITFILGYLAHIDPLLSGMLGLFVFVVLLSRGPLHKFSRQQVKPNEIQAAVILFVLALGIWPLLPNQAIDPWGLLNIKNFVMIITLIAGVQFVSYIAIRIFGESIGLPLSGILGGFISSTVVLLTMPGMIKAERRSLYHGISATLFACASTFAFLLFVIGTLSIELFWTILPAIIFPIIISTLVALILARKKQETTSFSAVKNPISLIPALKLALTFSGLIVVIGIIHRFLGPTGTQVASFMGGLLELHGVSISATLLYLNKTLGQIDAKNSILLAALASIISKIVVTLVLDRGRYATIVSLVLVLMMASMGLGLIFE